MKNALGLFIFSISFGAFGSNMTVCSEMKSEQIKIGLTAFNLANAETTRTVEGGAYRPYKIKSCSNGRCVTERGTNPILRYLPDHPDADQNGYVAFPDLDIQTEYAVLNMSVAKLRLLGGLKFCGVKIIDNKSSILLQYPKDIFNLTEDIFNFDTNQQVISWARTDAKGKSTVLNFRSDGTVGSRY